MYRSRCREEETKLIFTFGKWYIMALKIEFVDICRSKHRLHNRQEEVAFRKQTASSCEYIQGLFISYCSGNESLDARIAIKKIAESCNKGWD